MKNFTCLLLLCFLMPGCSLYQYATLSGNGLAQNDQKEFVSENDSLKITYNFNGYNCPVNITVYNKLAKPLYVNWKKSAVISNGKAISYYSPDYHVNGTINGYSIEWARGFANQTAGISANIDAQEGMEFIPPQSYITKKPLEVSDLLYNDTDTSMKKITLEESDVRYRAHKKVFTEQNSPVLFRSYLTILFGNDEKETSIEHTFYVKEILQNYTAPQNFVNTVTARGDTYFVSEATGFGKSVATVGLIGVGIGAAAIAANAQKK